MKIYVTKNANSQPSTSDSRPWMGNKNSSLTRLRGPKRSVPHLLLGLVIVIACASSFLWISLTADDRQPVLALVRTVPVGHVLAEQDLREVNVVVGPEVRVVAAGQAAQVVGKTVSVTLPAGALLTPESTATPVVSVAGQALVSLALKTGQFPLEAGPGARVSVVLAPTGSIAGSPSNQPGEIWPGVVISVSSPANEQVTVMSVQVAEAAAHEVAAVPAGQLSLVLLSGGVR